MADIYSEAAEVVVFLGGGPGGQMKGSKNQKGPGPCTVFTNTPLDDNLTNQALLNWTTPGRRQQITAFDLFCLLRILSQSPEALDPFEALGQVPDVHLTAMFESLRQMLTARWWDRIWVVQEAVIAKSITLRYGGVSAPWQMVAEAALTHFQRARPDHDSPVSRDDIKVLNLLSRVQDIDNFRRVWGENDKPSILSLLREFSNRKASDERDKVYALLGLCDQKTGIRPDYSFEVRETYMLATIDIILRGQSLSVLTGDLGRKERRDLPSWVPDWSATFDEHDRKRVPLFNHYNACGDVRGRILEDDRIGWHIKGQMAFLAKDLQLEHSLESLPPLALSVIIKRYKSAYPRARNDCDAVIKSCHSDGRRDIKTLVDYSIIEFEPREWEGCLKVGGHRIGTVEKTTPPLYSSSDMNAVSDAITSWYKYAELSQPLAFSRNGFVSTILSGVKKTTNGFKRLGPDDERVISYWYRCKIEREHPDWVDPDATQPSPEILDAFTEVMRLSVTNRTFFIARDGKMGLGPASIANGDEIHVLPGGKLPFVLRRVKPPANLDPWPHMSEPTTFNLIGDCFLHGAMDDQLWLPQRGTLPARLLRQVMSILQKSWENCGLELGAILGLKVKESPGSTRYESTKRYEWPTRWPEMSEWGVGHGQFFVNNWDMIYRASKVPKDKKRPGRDVSLWNMDIIRKMEELYQDWVELTEVGEEVEKGFIYLV